MTITRALATSAMVLQVLNWSASAKPQNPVMASGYVETSRGRTLLKAAMATANSILTQSAGYRLIGSWERAPVDIDSAKLIRVYLVTPTRPPFLIQVPFRSCRCIFVQEG